MQLEVFRLTCPVHPYLRSSTLPFTSQQGLALHLMGNCFKIMAASISRRMRPYKSKLGFADYGTSDSRCELGNLRGKVCLRCLVQVDDLRIPDDSGQEDHNEQKADVWLREAETCQQEAFKLASMEGESPPHPPDTSLQARALKSLGVCLHARSEYDAAFQLHRLASSVCRSEC